MSGFCARGKRVTDPLDDDAKARLIGGQLSYGTSGSEHSADDDSPCLSELVHGFLEVDEDLETQSYTYDSDSDRVDSVSDCAVDAVKSLCVTTEMDLYRNLLLSHVLKGVEMFSLWRNQKPVLRRKVMSFLRELGHNAAICKTKWDSSGGLNAGNYEFIDAVVLSNRYIIDLDFASQFEIARPTKEYWKQVQSLPIVFVGKNEDLKRIIKVMSDAAKRSLKSRDLSLPPWRKNRYMQNKWLGPYCRTSNHHQISSNPTMIGAAGNGVKCRLVGFDDAVNSGLFVRTR
ncbi:uncharacterized protein LOC8259689 [Ricinus communis]|uniref:DUF506 domain-containing protein n=1 Tax=Ricinus communis TaxID=3988 RepID=B9SMN1_RICCO|nr:uncharacterized protein LOC8259689 [Ricinus communis]EEF35094.1 conserved hypothetical protein [Ricinus communis]|eukprot:XP_015579704.1 uncharacterized protein LOC8259689 [Ricinus communis]